MKIPTVTSSRIQQLGARYQDGLDNEKSRTVLPSDPVLKNAFFYAVQESSNF